ncbi:hypothetical protein KXQ82_12070 [Mucilaginibacter sp. HMF5004]|uniref:hypothetical protein n=1 Tax=Mucilaginibacter rivuli TaxID=2857527 RepID=UPI001C5D8534|nr:hypothetical protein [Mucilaginibacter rivuli]MBW4890462.1 hypothetical protein [Mucilaginibacter rivuli]
MGMISAWFWKELELQSRRSLWYSVQNCFYAIVLSAVFLGEGVICLIIVSPLIFCFVIVGKGIGDAIFKKDNITLNVSVFGLLAPIFIADSLSKHQYENMVSDSIVINAPPAKVWKNVVAFKPIKQKPNFWLFQIGMPSPMATTVTGYYKGAGRKCIFSNGYVFGEKIVSFDPGKDLTFDIIDQPRDPEIMGHIDIERGQFLLKDNGNGTTTVTGNSWYKLYVFPVWYYDIWAQSITRNVHLRVMEHIKELSEKN